MDKLPQSKPVPKHAELKLSLVDSVWQFAPAFQRWAESQTGHDGLSAQRLRILILLRERGPMIMRELTSLLGVSPTNVTALIDSLEKDSYVRRQPHPEDRRATVIALTAQAEKTLDCHCLAYRERVSTLFDELSATESEQLLNVLSKLQQRLDSR